MISQVSISIDSCLNIQEYSKYLKYIICNICKGITIDPYFCESCIYSFCEKCLFKCEIKDYSCPREKNNTLILKNAKEDLNKVFKNLCIKCPICKEIYIYPQISSHKCNLEDNQIIIKCEFCFREINKLMYPSHLVYNCTEYYITCKYCDGKVERTNERDHILICKVRKERTCNICNQFFKKDFFEHYYQCSQKKEEEINKSLNENNRFSIQNEELFTNPINAPRNDRFSIKSGANLENLKKRSTLKFQNQNDENLPNQLNTDLYNFNLILSLILKGNETSFCRNCKKVKKINDLICCSSCKKAFCSYCCKGCKDCEQLLDKNCFKQCSHCNNTFCSYCNTKVVNYCVCNELIFCSQICFSVTSFRHICRYLQIIKIRMLRIYVLNLKELGQFKCEINLASYTQSIIYISIIQKGRNDIISSKMSFDNVEDKLVIIYNKEFIEYKTSKDYAKIENNLVQFLLINFQNSISETLCFEIFNSLSKVAYNKNEDPHEFLPIKSMLFQNLIS